MAASKGNNYNPKGHPPNLVRTGGTRPNAGRMNEEIREILRMGTKEGAPLQALIAQGKSPFPDVPDYTPAVHEIQKSFEICAKHALPELQNVVEERLLFDIAEVLAENEKIPFECIGEITDALIARWSPQHSPSA